MKRVVITGMGGVTALGHDWASLSRGLREGISGIRTMTEWADYRNLATQLGGPVDDFVLPAHYPRKKIRAMGRVAQLATRATELALDDAGLLNDPLLHNGRCGIAYGSSTGSTDATMEFALMLHQRDMTRVSPTTYIRMMGHTTAVNLSVFFGVKGRVYTTSSACTSGSQGIGYAYEAIRAGQQTVMIAGGAEELCPSEAAVFDTFNAASTRNDAPHTTPSPFDRDRDGLVIGEGATTLILEELEHARARGATIFGEVVGFGTNCDGAHITLPDGPSMQQAMELALEDAGLPTDAIGYINAHGTATGPGDIAESQATAALFGNRVPFSSLKGHLGHTLGAGGAIEAWSTLQMMREGWLAPTLNLNNLDPECAELDYIVNSPRTAQVEYAMSNNFAFGGINTSLIFRLSV
ncbi:beta-ketoacyl-ACP synthase [Marinimicrobium sp. ABcell2]|uniref:beta-ketoacyl-ACP synthase n=1 Tax=Marinimicrobium sp. ABcell2 TaxID=3069751 RepID=UPI0027AEBACB|nr:beta-ketoacyl-ACP synthase [Marinimicrobium sp. ABcell2]MDQ2076960.1 beta-ketoacyl-ACP synthase [Marinimicrobium sp. ABcell2]